MLCLVETYVKLIDTDAILTFKVVFILFEVNY